MRNSFFRLLLILFLALTGCKPKPALEVPVESKIPGGFECKGRSLDEITTKKVEFLEGLPMNAVVVSQKLFLVGAGPANVTPALMCLGDLADAISSEPIYVALGLSENRPRNWPADPGVTDLIDGKDGKVWLTYVSVDVLNEVVSNEKDFNNLFTGVLAHEVLGHALGSEEENQAYSVGYTYMCMLITVEESNRRECIEQTKEIVPPEYKLEYLDHTPHLTRLFNQFLERGGYLLDTTPE